MSTDTVFVYGTLRPGQGNHALLRDATHLGGASASGLVLHNGPGFPYAAPGEGTITGDLFEVTPRELHRLDLLEGYTPGHKNARNHYIRARHATRPHDHPDQQVTAWIYLAGPRVTLNHYPRISRGDWTTR